MLYNIIDKINLCDAKLKYIHKPDNDIEDIIKINTFLQNEYDKNTYFIKNTEIVGRIKKPKIIESGNNLSIKLYSILYPYNSYKTNDKLISIIDHISSLIHKYENITIDISECEYGDLHIFIDIFYPILGIGTYFYTYYGNTRIYMDYYGDELIWQSYSEKRITRFKNNKYINLIVSKKTSGGARFIIPILKLFLKQRCKIIGKYTKNNLCLTQTIKFNHIYKIILTISKKFYGFNRILLE